LSSGWQGKPAGAVKFWVVVQFKSIDADKIGAKIEQGLVTLTLPEHVKPRRITVS
jgi:hypothetical protein